MHIRSYNTTAAKHAHQKVTSAAEFKSFVSSSRSQCCVSTAHQQLMTHVLLLCQSFLSRCCSKLKLLLFCADNSGLQPSLGSPTLAGGSCYQWSAGWSHWLTPPDRNALHENTLWRLPTDFRKKSVCGAREEALGTAGQVWCTPYRTVLAIRLIQCWAGVLYMSTAQPDWQAAVLIRYCYHHQCLNLAATA